MHSIWKSAVALTSEWDSVNKQNSWKLALELCAQCSLPFTDRDSDGKGARGTVSYSCSEVSLSNVDTQIHNCPLATPQPLRHLSASFASVLSKLRGIMWMNVWVDCVHACRKTRARQKGCFNCFNLGDWEAACMVLSKFTQSQSFSAILLAAFAQAWLSDIRSSVPSARVCRSWRHDMASVRLKEVGMSGFSN